MGQRLSAFLPTGAAVLAVLTSYAGLCWAQEPAAMPQDELTRVPVGQRPLPGYDPLGIRWNSMLLYPRVKTGVLFNSNVFATRDNPQTDFAVVVSPGVIVRSETPRRAFEFDIGADIYRYHKFSDQDRVDGHARARTRQEITRDLLFETAFEAARRHEVPGEASAPKDAREPVPYNELRAEAMVTKTFNRFAIGVGAGVRNLTYEDVDSITGDRLDQTWRNGTILTATLKPSYQFATGQRLYARLRANTREYAGEGDQNRDSEGYDARAGYAFALTPLIFGSVEVGYFSQSYKSPLLQPVDGASGAAKLTWLATPLMTVSLFADRSVAETAQQDVEARLDTLAGLKIDYELFRNVIISGKAEYVNQDFEGSSREDDIVRLSLGLDYRMNRSIEVGVRYDFKDRSSTDSLYTYESHAVMFNVTARR